MGYALELIQHRTLAAWLGGMDELPFSRMLVGLFDALSAI